MIIVIHYYVINQVISYWLSYWSEVSCIGPRTKAEGRATNTADQGPDTFILTVNTILLITFILLVYSLREGVGGTVHPERILQECSCIIEFIKRVEEKRENSEVCGALYHFFAMSIIYSLKKVAQML